MSKRKRLLERIKTVLICVLLVTALFLGTEIGFFADLLSAFRLGNGLSAGRPQSGAEELLSVTDAQVLKPMAVVVTGDSGARYGAYLDGESTDAAYDKFSAVLAEALGSAGNPRPATAETVKNALAADSVLIDFGSAHRLSYISAWLGTEMNSDAAEAAARRLCMAESGDEITLFYLTDGQWYQCGTGLAAGTVQAKALEFEPNGAEFIWALGERYSKIDPWFVVLEEQPSISSIEAKNPFRANYNTDLLLEAFGLNSFTANAYSDADGVMVYVEGDRTLRISPEGQVNFRAAGNAALQLDADTDANRAEQITMVYALISSLLNTENSCAAVTCSGYTRMGENTYTLQFDYMVNGIPVLMQDEQNAVEVQITDGRITNMSIWFREYTEIAGREMPMPFNLMLANFQAGSGGEPVLIYEDDGTEVEAFWSVR